MVFMLFILIANSQDKDIDDCDKLLNDLTSVPFAERIYVLNDFEGPTKCLVTGANLISSQAKIEKDSLILSKVYAIMAYSTNPEFSINYADSLINLNQRPKDYYFFEKHLIKGYVYYYLEEPAKAISEFESAFQLGEKNNDFAIKTRALIWIATIKETYNTSNQALDVYLLALKSLDDWDDEKEEDVSLRASVLQSIIASYINKKDPENAELYLKQLKDVLSIEPIEEFIPKIRVWEAKIQYYKKNYEEAANMVEVEIMNTTGSEQLDLLYTLGKIYEENNQDKLKTKTFLKFDSISQAANLPPIVESKEVYLYLLNISLKDKSNEKQLYHYDKLIEIDSILTVNKIASEEKEIPGYSISEIKKERDLFLSKNKKKSILVFILIAISTLILLSFLFYFIKYKKASKDLADYLDRTSKADNKNIISADNSLPEENNLEPEKIRNTTIEKEIEPSIKLALYKLDKWEEEKGFLDKDVDLNVLATLFKTNRTYISKCVNIYKNQTFRNYITELRMNHFIETTRMNYDYKNKSLNVILEEFGFNSIDTFNRALKQKLNNKDITPGMYMKEIIKRNT
tara:strand:- start:19 stop:1734 length:1716 start_codon:yes stop_codon:yes gene_type:complete